MNYFDIVNLWQRYCFDTCQRSLLFLDVLRKRGDIYLKHLEGGKPPVLSFDYRTVIDGRSHEPQVNYDLVKIIPPKTGCRPDRRPIVIIDPRAGHGPGIGGFKEDSEVGVAMKNGHPVYFVTFHPEPIPGQTLADIEATEKSFLEEVNRRHYGLPKPLVIGNCQAGWAAALLAADEPDSMSTLVMAGSPLSYWAGVRVENPMRYRGGLLGGSWVASLVADMGNGIFDGAWLVDGFELLNPANTLWGKMYNLYSKVDTEEKRFLNFEKWWGGFFFMTTQEIEQIVQDLFVGNKLEKNEFVLREGDKPINMKDIKANIVVLASKGDNITPPQQALNWIPAVYDNVEEIIQMGRRIVYIVHPTIGHLGIFVASSLAKKEHRAIIGGVRKIDKLDPGLYELMISDDGTYSFEKRTFEDIAKFGDGHDDSLAFERVKQVSEMNQSLYKKFVRPFVQVATNSVTAEIVKQIHPLRVSRYIFTSKNPVMKMVKNLAPIVKQNRIELKKDNCFSKIESNFSEVIEEGLKYFGAVRDSVQELAFYEIYG